MRDDVREMSERDESGGGEVLRSLPPRRPQRRSSRREAPAGKVSAATPKAPGAAKRPRAAKPAKARAKPGSRPNGAPGSAKLKSVRPSAATRAASSTPAERPAHPPEGVELVGTAVQAVGELAQIGLTLGTKALRGAVKRIPRP
jgi:hypothetical protein